MKIQKSQYESAIITTLVAVLILLLLFLCGMTAERNEMDEGVMVSFGDVDEGFGEQTPAPEEAPATAAASTNVAQPVPEQPKVNDQKLMTQEDPSVALEREKKRKAEAAEAERKRQEAAAEQARKEAEAKKAKAAAIAGTGFRKTGSGQGSDEGDGKKGNPAGHGSQGGNSWNVAGRSLTGKLAQPSYNVDEEGKIVVNIRVDASGKVVAASIGAGTTITSEALRQKAIEAAKKNTFSAGESAAQGQITYNFKLN